jgi:hypothetical protein
MQAITLKGGTPNDVLTHPDPDEFEAVFAWESP